MDARTVAGPWRSQRLYCRGPLPARDADKLTVPDRVPIFYRPVQSCGFAHRARVPNRSFWLAVRTLWASVELEQQAGVVG
jgi:hypothetical protein